MTRRLGLLCLGVLALGLRASPDNAAVEDPLRRGNAAFEAGNYSTAADLYDKAEVARDRPGPGGLQPGHSPLSPRPGRGGHNPAPQAAADGRTGLPLQRGRRGRAAPSRALFGLANCLLQGRGDEVAATRAAIRYYRGLLSGGHLEASLTDDARHNLELAKLLWLKARAKKDASPEKDRNENQPNDSSQQQQGDDRERMQGADPGTDPMAHGAGRQQIQSGDGQDATPTQRPTPGAGGDLPPTEDDGKPTQLTPEETRENLANAIEAINRDRRTQRLRSRRPVAGPVKDW